MAQSKASKRKRKAQAQPPAQPPGKAAKAADQAADGEPLSLQAVISDEELDLAVDTLTTLARHPGLTKSKLCRALRVAVYDFRQSCATGVNAADGGSLTARVSAALADDKLLDARVLLAEMRLRGQQPKLGALCRWVRDLDVVTRPRGVSIAGPERSPRDTELLAVLDAVLRISCPVDLAPLAVPAPAPGLGTFAHIAMQPVWDQRPSPRQPQPVYASVLDGSILARAPPWTAMHVVETTPGHLRQPPNHHPAILYTTDADAVALSAEPRGITMHKHPHVPNLGLAANALSADECKAIIAAGESVGFLPDAPIREGGDTSVLAHNFYWVVDVAFHDRLWARMAPFVPAELGGRRARGLNRRFRVYRYVPGAEYRCHIDGAWPPSGIRPDGSYVYDDSPPEKKQSSLFTFLLYLNDEFEGGETTFYMPGAREGVLHAYPVRPVMGAVAIFPHGEAQGALLHEGTSVHKGAKYIIRTDIEYDVEP